MFTIDEYMEAQSVAEALALLAENPERRFIAGGTDLLIQMRRGALENVKLVGLRRAEPLRAIRRHADESIGIGPLATFREIAGHPLVQKHLPILAEAALTVGGPQIRAAATIGGNICNGAPSADSAPSLLVLDALLRLQQKQGERVIPLQEFFLGPGRVDLRPGELLTEIVVAPDHYLRFGGCYIKFAPRKAMDLATLGVAVTCRMREKEIMDEVRIALAVAGPTPRRCGPAEEYARGKRLDEKTAAQIGRLALKSAAARTSRRASREYREHLIVELTQRALKTAAARAGGA